MTTKNESENVPYLSPSALAEGRRLMEAATPGPWESEDIGAGTVACGLMAPASSVVMHDFISPSDAALCAWMRNRLPALLSAAERLSQVKARVDALPTFDDPEQMGECISDIDEIVRGAR